MRRLFWLAMGVTIGVMVVRRISRLAERMTPGNMAGGLADALRDLADAIGSFGHDVRQAMSEREAELRAGTGLDGSFDRPEGDGPLSRRPGDAAR